MCSSQLSYLAKYITTVVAELYAPSPFAHGAHKRASKTAKGLFLQLSYLAKYITTVVAELYAPSPFAHGAHKRASKSATG